MINIARLLFAATVVLIFALLLIFYSFGYAGNGGEYWGFDGYIDARQAARNSFEEGEMRFLKVDMTDATGKRLQFLPGIVECDVHPLGSHNISRNSGASPLHGPDSASLATDFARTFNFELVELLMKNGLAECDVLKNM